MIQDWDKAINFVLEQEGGYTVDPNDPGGETKYGISKKAYPNLDIKNLTVEQAKAIYKKDFWAACSCDYLPSGFAISVFDMAVNQGVKTAIMTLQKTVGTVADGIIGPMTIAAANNANPRKHLVFLAERLAAYVRLMQAKPNLLIYAVNWSFRVVSLARII